MVNIIFNILLIRTLGGIGAAIATSISFATIAFIRMYAIKEIREMKLHDYKMICSLILLVGDGIITCLDLWVWIKILIVASVLFLYRNEYISILHVVKRKICNRKEQ